MVSGTVYTCPMHPEVEERDPGICPSCGMALEPAGVAANDEDSTAELVDFKRRLWFGSALTIPLLILSMGPMLGLGFARELLGQRAAVWVELGLATPVVLWAGAPFLLRGWASVVSRKLNMFTLIALGIAAAYLFSVAAVVAPGLFPAGFRDAAGQVGVYFEAAAVIVIFVLLGQVMELSARQRTGAAIRSLLDLAAKTARIIRQDGTEEEIPLEQVKVGDRVRVPPGNKVPVDGVVMAGRSDPGRKGRG